uniref:Peroxidase n=1 Tax=Timema cristinae TaxID=61476 RepID=A0A7R9H991_TIMCR|nr:unnamed protein product [Timema cristinae]
MLCFSHPDDIDLWSAGVAENSLPGSMVGPTFNCIIARTFKKLKIGDRFWYENKNLPNSFTPDQLSEIRKVRLSRLLCDTSDEVETVQIYSMVLPDPQLNPRVSCKSKILHQLDLSKWKEDYPDKQNQDQFTAHFSLVQSECRDALLTHWISLDPLANLGVQVPASLAGFYCGLGQTYLRVTGAVGLPSSLFTRYPVPKAAGYFVHASGNGPSAVTSCGGCRGPVVANSPVAGGDPGCEMQSEPTPAVGRGRGVKVKLAPLLHPASPLEYGHKIRLFLLYVMSILLYSTPVFYYLPRYRYNHLRTVYHKFLRLILWGSAPHPEPRSPDYVRLPILGQPYPWAGEAIFQSGANQLQPDRLGHRRLRRSWPSLPPNKERHREPLCLRQQVT